MKNSGCWWKGRCYAQQWLLHCVYVHCTHHFLARHNAMSWLRVRHPTSWPGEGLHAYIWRTTHSLCTLLVSIVCVCVCRLHCIIRLVLFVCIQAEVDQWDRCMSEWGQIFLEPWQRESGCLVPANQIAGFIKAARVWCFLGISNDLCQGRDILVTILRVLIRPIKMQDFKSGDLCGDVTWVWAYGVASNQVTHFLLTKIACGCDTIKPDQSQFLWTPYARCWSFQQ